jgi:hypothetical protein
MAQSVLFIVEHCPLLISLHIGPVSKGHRGPQDDRYGLSLRRLASLTLALVEVVQRRPSLEVIGIIAHVIEVYFSASGSFAEVRTHWVRDLETSQASRRNIDLQLTDIPMYARKDTVRTWCDKYLRQAIEYDGLVDFVDLTNFECIGVEAWRFE